MRFREHLEIEGSHAFMGASKYHWIHDDLEKIERRWDNQFASARGTRLHRLAKFCIEERQRLADLPLTLNMYVNDAIGFRMTPEVAFVYSENCFGTADAAKFEKGIFRVHDLKTGQHPASFHQTEVYCALFCLEYDVNPYDIEMIMRIYQSDQVFEQVADPNAIRAIMDRVLQYDPLIEKKKAVML